MQRHQSKPVSVLRDSNSFLRKTWSLTSTPKLSGEAEHEPLLLAKGRGTSYFALFDYITQSGGRRNEWSQSLLHKKPEMANAPQSRPLGNVWVFLPHTNLYKNTQNKLTVVEVCWKGRWLPQPVHVSHSLERPGRKRRGWPWRVLKKPSVRSTKTKHQKDLREKAEVSVDFLASPGGQEGFQLNSDSLKWLCSVTPLHCL